MPGLAQGFSPKLIKLFSQAVSTGLLVSVFFIMQYVFEMKFACVCKPGRYVNTVLFIVFPPLILVWIVSITEPIHKRRMFFRCYFPCNCCSRFKASDISPFFTRDCCCGFIQLCSKGILDYLILSVIWSTAVLFDGDWLVCLQTNRNPAHTGIPCRGNLTNQEEIIKAGYKTESVNYGLIISSVFVVVWSLSEWIHFSCGRKRGCCCCSRCCCCPRPYYKVIYEDLLEEQVRKHLNNKLLEMAKERAEDICRGSLNKIREDGLKNRGENNDDTWWDISAPDLCFTVLTRDDPQGVPEEAPLMGPEEIPMQPRQPPSESEA